MSTTEPTSGIQKFSSSQRGRRPSIIFLHASKTAGTTLRRILVRQYGEEAIFVIDGFDPGQSVRAFQQLRKDEQRRVEVFVGHMAFGMHRFVPTACSYITLLRHPVDRLVSHYLYVSRTPTNVLHDEVVSHGLSLEKYIRGSKAASVFNDGQTRLLGGHVLRGPDPAATEATLDAAKRNLVKWFAVAGLTERFDESVLLMSRVFGWRWPLYAREKVAPSRPRREDLAPGAVRAILELNQLDLEFYLFAADRFAQQVAQQGPGFAAQVDRFRALNLRRNGSGPAVRTG
ncbi:MAG: sulfotransferase family 2 domain-containing protein [Acidimicrobiia bacterium]